MNWFNIHFQVTLLIRFFTSFTLKSFFPSWTDVTCFFKSPFLDNLWSQTSHLNGLFHSWTVATCLFQLHFWQNLRIHIWRLIFFMNQCNMMIYITHFKKRVVTYLTFEWLISIMNSWNMAYWFQVTILIKSIVTNFTFKWLVSFTIFQELCPDL